jgi:haloalkane dehalogenase
MTTVDVRSKPWFKEGEYPFESRYLDVPGGKLHYVDEGQGNGSPIVFVHGTPSWSYEFRAQIRELRGKHRCIALDHLGFGLSERPVSEPLSPDESGFKYSMADHTANLKLLIESLGLERYSLVVHDFGGPIALPLVFAAPERIERLVIMNSWAWTMDNDPKFEKGRRYLDTWLTRFLYLRANFSASYLVKASWGTRDPLTPEIHARFKSMFPNKDSRLGTWGFARSLVRDEAYLEQLHDQVKGGRLERVPTLVIWGKADGLVGEPQLRRWKEELPGARFVELDGVGHFPQEEAPEDVGRLVSGFLS